MFRFAQHDRKEMARRFSLHESRGLGHDAAQPKNCAGVSVDLVLNCSMIRRALAVAVGLVAVCLPVAAQQANRPRATEGRAAASEQLDAAGALAPAFAMSLYQPKTFSANASSLLFHKGPVRAWSDGGQLASETALVEIGMGPLDLPPLTYFSPNGFGPAPTNKGRAVSNSRPENFGTDPKDSPEMMLSPPDRIYYGGEIGFLYGHSMGKGSGDLMESYIMGHVGNDHFQITAGAAFDQWSGQGVRFRSFNH